MNLRTRLSLGASALAALAVAAAVIAVVGLARTQSLATEAMAAQHRIESYSSLSARVNEWVMGRLGGKPVESSFAVLATLDLLDALVAEDVAAAPDQASATTRSGQRLVVARVRGQFAELEASLARHPLASPEGTAAIGFYAAQVPAMVAGQIQTDARRRESAMQQMEALRLTLRRLALGIAIAAPLVLIGLHMGLVRPLIRRLRVAGTGTDTAHDELSLALARIRRRTSRLDREQRRLEATIAERTVELSRANARLSAVDAQRRRFFADVSHELRTPLTVIMGEAELGLRDTTHHATFATIQGRALRLYRRIEDLLRIARSDSGQLDLQREPVDLAATIAAAQADLAPILRRAGVAVVVDVLPLTVTGDADWLRQVFAGLFENAAKYARGAQMTITATRDGTITVADTGPGIPPDRLDAVMDRFTKGEGRGFGVGLALARWVIEEQGGSIHAASEQGLRLTITLPLAQELEVA